MRSVGSSDGVAAGRAAGPADRHAADFLRGRDVAVQQRRGEIADRHVVEAVARLVSRQERGNVDVEREEIANRVLVFGSSQPADRRRAARIRIRFSSTVERFHEIRDHAASYVASFGRDFPTGGIWRARSFRTTFSRDLRMLGYVVSRDRFE